MLTTRPDKDDQEDNADDDEEHADQGIGKGFAEPSVVMSLGFCTKEGEKKRCAVRRVRYNLGCE